MNHTIWLFLLCDQVYLHLWGITGNFFFYFFCLSSAMKTSLLLMLIERSYTCTLAAVRTSCWCSSFQVNTQTHSHNWVFKRWQLFVFLHKSLFFITVSFILCDTCSPSHANLSIWHQTAPTVGRWCCYLLLSAVKVSVQQPRSEF